MNIKVVKFKHYFPNAIGGILYLQLLCKQNANKTFDLQTGFAILDYFDCFPENSEYTLGDWLKDTLENYPETFDN